MSTETTASPRLHITAKVLRVPSPWQAFVLPVSCFPIPEPECSRLAMLLGKISEDAAKRWNLHSEVFMELEQMKGNDCRYLFADHGREWIPEIGLGVWPDREPPALWSREEFESLSPGGKLREVLCEVFRISTSPQQRRAARDAMLTFGSVVEILTPDTTETFLGKMKPVYLDFIKARSHRCFPYYIPLLEGKTFEKLQSEQLEKFCTGISIYVRESFQDQGILVASTFSLSEVFVKLGGEFDDHPERANWRLPV